MADIDALVLAFSRNTFYKQLHYLALGVLTLMLFVIVFLIWMVIYLTKNPTHPMYFATDNVGRLINVISPNIPNMTTDKVISWTIEAVQAANSYDYVNYRSQLQSAEKYFTRYGWNNYMTALTASNNLIAITQRKMIVLATVVDQPKILAAGLLGDAYAWKFEMPMLVTNWLPPYDEKSKFNNPIKVSVIVQRQPTLSGYQGLGIVQIIEDIATVPVAQPATITAAPTE